jgi:hypothetical protein
MMFALLSAEQIVGTLASKILSAGSVGYGAPAGVTLNGALAAMPIQAVDIFLVQANTNSLLSHFTSLVCYLFLQTRLPKLLRGVSTSRSNSNTLSSRSSMSGSNTTAPQQAAADNAMDSNGSKPSTNSGALGLGSGGMR